jgi:hypothetical protein
MVVEPEQKRPIRKSDRRWEDNIKMYLREIKLEGMDRIHRAQDRDRWPARVKG